MVLSDSYKKLHNAILNLLARREYSKYELKRKFILKFSDELIDEVIQNIASKGWQSDTRFAADFAQFKLKSGCGPIKILHELIQRGVSEDISKNAINSIESEFLLHMRRLWSKKFKPADNLAEWMKQSRYLSQRGYTSDQIQTLKSIGENIYEDFGN